MSESILPINVTNQSNPLSIARHKKQRNPLSESIVPKHRNSPSIISHHNAIIHRQNLNTDSGKADLSSQVFSRGFFINSGKNGFRRDIIIHHNG